MTEPALRHVDLKARHRAVRDGFAMPLNLRVHRALSWLARAEAEPDDGDVCFILLWIGFNAAYAGDIGRAVEASERDAFRDFFETLLGFDGKKRIYAIIWQRFPHEIRMLLENRFVFAPFWSHQNDVPGYGDWADRLERSRTAINRALAAQDSATILSILFDRLYVLRNQLVHGGATWESEVNRAQVRDGAALLGCLLPVFIDLMMDASCHDWPMPHYPPVEE